MKIAAFDVYQYTLDLNYPLTVRGQQLKNRQGLIIHLTSDQGEEGFGDVAPLPGFSQETLPDVLDQIPLLRSKFCDQEIPDELIKFTGQFNQWLNPFNLKSSLRFGFESAVLHLLANSHHTSPYKLIPTTTTHPGRSRWYRMRAYTAHTKNTNIITTATRSCCFWLSLLLSRLS